MQTLLRPYVPDIYSYRRRRTREVMVGSVGVGGANPIRVQSMTTTLTRDIDATVDQAERLVRVGCEIVRITTPTPADARCLGPIREMLEARGVHVPLVADIHFSPAAALAAAEYADKVRVNPGNYTDSRKFAQREYTDAQYMAEIERVEERFSPLVLKCKERGIAMRIGTNHGSLSDRIMNRFGDTPEGMVESALEFVHICRKHEYHDLILSMKASNPKIMIAAYRLLAARMRDEGMDYPFHLGVTEAGNAEDGRIKSAAGIGSLLEDGIGDTIRVSLTEEPEAEIPVAFTLANRYIGRQDQAGTAPDNEEVSWDPYHFERRKTAEVRVGEVMVGGSQTAAVFAPIEGPLSEQQSAMAMILRWASPAGRRQPKPDVALVYLRSADDLTALKRISERLQRWPQARLSVVAESDDTALLLDALPYVDGVMQCVHPGDDPSLLAVAVRDADKALFLHTPISATDEVQPRVEDLLCAVGASKDQGARVIATVTAPETESIHAVRRLAAGADARNLRVPILLQNEAGPDSLISASVSLGSPLCDGIGDAILVTGSEDDVVLAFNILQATGTRITKTDYVACPSCGRTLFDLQETTERIKRRTSHLVGVRLAIMGCIVNGPGEMADADFGYVGGAPGQVNLYVGKECVQKGVPADEADDRLIDLIKARGKWQEDDEN